MLLVVHVAAGSAALLLAVPLAAGRMRWSGAVGLGYGVSVTVVAVTAAALAGPGSTLPTSVRLLLLVVALATWLAVLGGLLGVRQGHPGAKRLLRGSVVSLVTAVAVVSGPPALWVAAGVAGTVWVELTHRRVSGGPAAPQSERVRPLPGR